MIRLLLNHRDYPRLRTLKLFGLFFGIAQRSSAMFKQALGDFTEGDINSLKINKKREQIKRLVGCIRIEVPIWAGYIARKTDNRWKRKVDEPEDEALARPPTRWTDDSEIKRVARNRRRASAGSLLGAVSSARCAQSAAAGRHAHAHGHARARSANSASRQAARTTRIAITS
ncbi:hypothetical protein MSG28_014408 [Choristoneura fumiferana]|uniref:Uncharacterized protein n=1 Tax=Choristoneura fumiferana TaxID=7141 RepID=A0ACC0JRA4_CHOFU|nr:hypothetical protein MSG28_014408 [Choristoneura fumiferana]